MRPSPASSGNKYILLFEGQFTKWYEAIRMGNQQASAVARAFVNERVSVFGFNLLVLISIVDSNFMSNLFKSMCKELRSIRTSATTYHPLGNAMVEHNNRTMEEIHAKYVGEHHNTWRDYLRLVMMAHRSSIHSMTQYSPLCLLFGQSCALPIDCMYQTIQTKIYPTSNEYFGS